MEEHLNAWAIAVAARFPLSVARKHRRLIERAAGNEPGRIAVMKGIDDRPGT